MNLKSAGCCGFFGLALLVVVEVAMGAWVLVLRLVVVLPVGSRHCLKVLGSAALVSMGARLVGDLGATEMHSQRSW
jgi:hypothetical protein